MQDAGSCCCCCHCRLFPQRHRRCLVSCRLTPAMRLSLYASCRRRYEACCTTTISLLLQTQHDTTQYALISLHWLRVPERIRPTFKVATLTHHALHGSAPPNLASSFTCVADMPHRRRLRFASTEQLDVPTCRRSTVGGRAFPVAGAKVWNGLPSEVTSASSLSVFKNRLKTYLFCRCNETV